MAMRRRLVVVAAVVALAGCATVPADVASTASPSRSHQPTAMVPTAAGLTRGTSAPPAEPLTIAFAGDMNFEDETRARLDADPASVFGVAQQATRLADLTFGNLETSVGTAGNPEPKAYTFRAPPTVFDALASAGFDAVSLANNHAVDFGAPALEETLQAIGATHVAVAGVGADAAAAYAPVFLAAKGRRVAFLAASQIKEATLANWTADDDSPGIAAVDERFFGSVAAADPRADITIVYLHWGVENTTCSSQLQQETADRLIAAGADVIVGSHSHKLMGAGWLGRTFVAYGLGNYLWYAQNSEETTRTGVVTVTFDESEPVGLTYAPARIVGSGIPEPMVGSDAEHASRRFEELRECTNLTATPGG